MKDFDVARAKRKRSEEERTFKIAGETFVLKNGVRPEALAGFDEINENSPIADSMGAWDTLFLEMVEDSDDAHERYRQIRSDSVDPLTIEDLEDMVGWMMEQVTGRPTGSPSGSTAGREETGTTSMDDSSSPVLTAV